MKQKHRRYATPSRARMPQNLGSTLPLMDKILAAVSQLPFVQTASRWSSRFRRRSWQIKGGREQLLSGGKVFFKIDSWARDRRVGPVPESPFSGSPAPPPAPPALRRPHPPPTKPEHVAQLRGGSAECRG